MDRALTRLLDPDSVLKGKVSEFIAKGDFGLGSGQRPDSSFERVWFEEHVDPADVTFDKDVFLLTKATAQKSNVALVTGGPSEPGAAARSSADAKCGGNSRDGRNPARAVESARHEAITQAACWRGPASRD